MIITSLLDSIPDSHLDQGVPPDFYFLTSYVFNNIKEIKKILF